AVQAQSGSLHVPIVASAPAVDGTLGSPVWQQALTVHLGYDRRTRGPTVEDTTVRLLSDGKALYVAFQAIQTRTPVVSNQRSNMVGVDTDDEVKVALWPGGSHGFSYQFIATPLGTRYQYSSENLAYEPTWDAVGRIGRNAYVVTMRIPLSIMRGARPEAWLIQLARY
ncbi:MAG: hypothetical protein M3T49_02670, partial [Candidatus Eremiobacteraeota bacterium]|nr:hypothetical protein [Candidatus Eremiobacteraeota bacterium]